MKNLSINLDLFIIFVDNYNTIYYNSTDANKLFIDSKMLEKSHGSIFSVYNKLKKMMTKVLINN